MWLAVVAFLLPSAAQLDTWWDHAHLINLLFHSLLPLLSLAGSSPPLFRSHMRTPQ
jgi:hypothetical protein